MYHQSFTLYFAKNKLNKNSIEAQILWKYKQLKNNLRMKWTVHIIAIHTTEMTCDDVRTDAVTSVIKTIFHKKILKILSAEYKGYRMVPFNLKELAKFCLCSHRLQKLHGCSLACTRKIFAFTRILGFSRDSH